MIDKMFKIYTFSENTTEISKILSMVDWLSINPYYPCESPKTIGSFGSRQKSWFSWPWCNNNNLALIFAPFLQSYVLPISWRQIPSSTEDFVDNLYNQR